MISVLRRLAERPLRILHLEDSTLDAELVSESLALGGLESQITRVWSRADFVSQLETGSFHIILCDYQLPDFDGASALEIAKAKRPDLPFVFVSGALGEEAAVEAIRNGATDYVVKQRLDRLPYVVVRALKEAAERSERMRAETALRESETRLLGITNSIDQMIWSCRPDGVHDYYNDRWYEFTGLAYGATTESSSLLHPDDLVRTQELWQRALQTGEPYRNEYRLRHNSGDYRWVLSRAQPVRDEEGRVARWFGTYTDIEEIVAAREVLARSREQLEREVEARTAELLKVEEQVRQLQKMEAVGQLTGGIAHDFNNMMAVVIGGLNLLQRRLSKGETDVSRYIDAAMDGAKRAAGLTQRLLAFSRQQPLAPQVLDPNRMVRDMGEMLPRVLRDDIEVELALNPEVWPIYADKVQLESALLNLSVNARDAMSEGGKLTITTDVCAIDEALARVYQVDPGEYVLINVNDTGSGMSPDVLSQAFDPFFTTKGVGKGTGLGLSQVLGFIRQSGGHVKIYSEEGIGTSAKIYLPRYAGADMRIPVRPQVTPAPGDPNTTILVVEDDDRVRAYSVEALRELGYSVLHASSGAEALELLGSRDGVSLLFTDMVMPALHGRELAELARQSDPNLKVLYTTGYSRDAIANRLMLDSNTQVLPKPFTIEQLATSVRRALEG